LSLTKQNIESLLVLCQDGNQLAQLEVYNRYQSAMYNVAFRIVKDTAEAEDIMQESFITAFSKLDMFKGDATFGSWLKRIVINKAITEQKKSSRFVRLPEVAIADTVDETHEGIAEDDYNHLKASEVMNCMNTLHDSYRQILSLHLIEGYDYEEICEILSISYANCRTMISRAKNSLRNKLTVTS
jgi:RNA polymerase sigma factor (sigma-70 family)